MSLTPAPKTHAPVAEPQRRSSDHARPAVGAASIVARLQRDAGNAVMHRLLRADGIQPKLTVNRPGDTFEREADRVADDVMRMTDPGEANAAARAPSIVQRMCAECEEEQQEKPVQRACSGCEREKDAEGEVESYVTNRHGGQPLPDSTREYFEPRFGQDFSAVRVHTDSDAVRSAAALSARAYTFGSNVVFGASEYAPETPAGRRLLAHELTHVVQQGASAPQRSDDTET